MALFDIILITVVKAGSAWARAVRRLTARMWKPDLAGT